MRTVFGGSKGGGSYVNKAQQPYLNDVYKEAQSLFGDTTGQDYANQFLDPTAAGVNTLMSGGYQMPGLTGKLNNFGTMQNQALDSAVSSGLNQVSNNFKRNIMPAINQGSALTGTSGGSRQGIAQAMAADDFNNSAGNMVNQMYSNNWANQMDNNLNATSQLGDLQQQQNQSLYQGVSSVPTISNMGFNNQYKPLDMYASAVGAPTVMGNSTTSNNGIASGFSGEGGSGIAGLMTMLSDIRLKRNIQRIGATPAGQSIYSYSYLWSDVEHIGVMAQESPLDAVIVTDSGYLAVDYSRIR